MAFAHQLRVRYGECDPQGIVFNANYLAYFDVAVTELWREAMGGWQVMVERGVDVVVGEANLRFRSPARNDDLLTISAAFTHFGTTSLTMELLIHREAELLVEGTLRQVFIDVKSYAKTPIPAWAREVLTPYAATGGAGA